MTFIESTGSSYFLLILRIHYKNFEYVLVTFQVTFVMCHYHAVNMSNLQSHLNIASKGGQKS